MLNPFVMRLRALTDLDEAELGAISALLSTEQAFGAEHQLVGEGDRPRKLHVLIDGWAAHVKWLRNGQRHLPAILLPGDLCDVDGLHLQAYDYGVVTLTPCRVATMDRDKVQELCTRYPAIARAFTWLGFVDNSLLGEAATSVARRSARQRVAHILCEFMMRLTISGRARADGYDLPLTQEKLGDALGLTAVHINRTVQALRKDGLVQFGSSRVIIPDWTALVREAGFSTGYLHLEGMAKAAA